MECRGKSCTHLISTYLECRGDVLKGADQNGDGLWGSVFENVEESRRLNPTLHPRTFKALTSLWKKINGDVNSWVGIYTEAKRKKWSDCNEKDVLTETREMWIKVHGPQFTLKHAWNVMKHDDKWADGIQMSGGSSKRSGLDEGASSKHLDGNKKVKSRRKAPTSNSPFPSSSEFTRRISLGEELLEY
ncbi:glutathione S-transferase T2-like [Beta vulgaris subsp. vulgaris]|uniref:glutathione S-transferase T2-like n=1 Tax=Beta vulgaris subsp. vulgaris TaxID=3555 RepID=UPI00053F54B0|nr:glutathione S-transferase T2-like [Beta vulgaris subsp. vulgaris]